MLDLINRIQINPYGIEIYSNQILGTTSISQINCETASCNSSELAYWDTAQWIKSISKEIPNAKTQLNLINPTLSIWRLIIDWSLEKNIAPQDCLNQKQCISFEFTPPR
jgi:hypothetical protein